MATLGDYVINRKTGQSGMVVGRGYEIVDSVYTPTLKVQIVVGTGFRKKTSIESDFIFNWKKVKDMALGEYLHAANVD